MSAWVQITLLKSSFALVEVSPCGAMDSERIRLRIWGLGLRVPPGALLLIFLHSMATSQTKKSEFQARLPKVAVLMVS